MNKRGFVSDLLILIAGLFLLSGGCSGKHSQSGNDNSSKTEISKTAEYDAKDEADLKSWCADLMNEVKRYKWTFPNCEWKGLKIGGRSVKGRPLVYREFGDPKTSNVTLIFSMVHGDEVTPLYTSMKLLEWLEKNINKFPASRVVVVPLVNPDGFFIEKQTRMNARGVDLNRNFATKDWEKSALSEWKRDFGADPRRYPGKSPESEPETVFQRTLLEKTNPTKILSLHSPLNFMDYDGPDVLTLSRFPREYVKTCLGLRKRLKAISGGFYPGSLGNYAGQERGIPTLTLEMPSANPKMAEKYWLRFLAGIETVIKFNVPDTVRKSDPFTDMQASSD